jgi:four helix bundle protein
MRDFKQLAVWEKAHGLTLAVYELTARFPKEETYGLSSQMRLCSSSVPANIAEGCGRTGNGDFYRFLDVAAGSLYELEYFLMLSRDLGFTSLERFQCLTERTREVQRMLASLLRKVGIARQSR